MNTLHFTYAVEVERCGSITQAAENLYMAQPNLSKAIKELEDTMGFAIFSRTSRGVVPTARGREFLVYARSILAQLHAMESLSGRHDDDMQRFRVAIPRSGYIAECFSRWVDTLDKGRLMDICVDECSAMRAVNSVSDGQFNLGVISYPVQQETYFLDYMHEKGLKSQPLWEYDALLLFSARHPLSQRREISAEDLAPYTLLTYGDNAVPYLPLERQEEINCSRIQVFSRLTRLELLSRVQDAYMWSSPETGEALKRFALSQSPCGAAPRLRDAIIYPAAYRFTTLDQRFIDVLQSAIKTFTK